MLRLAATFGMAPAAFWRTSVKEWRALVAPPDDGALSRSSFAALVARFPDQK